MNMKKLEKIYAVIIIVFPLLLIGTLTFFLQEDINIDSLSQERIVRGYENNVIDGKVAIEVKGTGFKENDKIYLNGIEEATAFGGEDKLTCLIPKEIYSDVNKVEVQVKRLSTSNKVTSKSNVKKIDICDAKEKNTKVIDEVSPKQIQVMQQENLIDGKVAISVMGSGFSADDKIYINNELQVTSFGGDKLLTCFVPKRFYVKPKDLNIQVKQTPKGDQVEVSNNLKIVVVQKGIGDNWYEKSDLIAHAFGMVNDKYYTNSYEAFKHNYELGHKVFETDLLLTSDNHLVARHDWSDDLLKGLDQDMNLSGPMDLNTFLNTPICSDMTPMSIEDIIKLMSEHKDVYIVTDTKETDTDIIKKQFQQIVDVANRIDPTTLDRIVPQIYNPQMLEVISKIYDWKNPIYTIYQSKETKEELINSIKKYNIKVVTIPEISATQEFIDELLNNNVHIYTHTINDEDKEKSYFGIGIYGVYTDKLTPEK